MTKESTEKFTSNQFPDARRDDDQKKNNNDLQVGESADKFLWRDYLSND